MQYWLRFPTTLLPTRTISTPCLAWRLDGHCLRFLGAKMAWQISTPWSSLTLPSPSRTQMWPHQTGGFLPFLSSRSARCGPQILVCTGAPCNPLQTTSISSWPVSKLLALHYQRQLKVSSSAIREHMGITIIIALPRLYESTKLLQIPSKSNYYVHDRHEQSSTNPKPSARTLIYNKNLTIIEYKI